MLVYTNRMSANIVVQIAGYNSGAKWSGWIHSGSFIRSLCADTYRYTHKSINQSINQYSFNERHVKTQANTYMTYNWVNVTS